MEHYVNFLNYFYGVAGGACGLIAPNVLEFCLLRDRHKVDLMIGSLGSDAEVRSFWICKIWSAPLVCFFSFQTQHRLEERRLKGIHGNLYNSVLIFSPALLNHPDFNYPCNICAY